MNVSPLAKTISGEKYYSLAGRGGKDLGANNCLNLII